MKRSAMLKETNGQWQLFDKEINYPFVYYELPNSELWTDFMQTAKEENWLNNSDVKIQVEADFELQPKDFLMKNPVLEVTDKDKKFVWNFVTGEITK